MPESSCLHIQDSASGPIRVVEVSWPMVRVGRAAVCEVRLNDPELPAEVCRFQRRGNTWQIEPIISDAVQIDGRPVNGVRLLPFDTPIHIGTYCLSLHASRLAAPNWNLYQAQEPGCPTPEMPRKAEKGVPTSWDVTPPSASLPKTGHGVEPPGATEPVSPSKSYKSPSPRPERGKPADRSGSAFRDQQLWEDRWRAAGEKLRAASPPKAPRSSVVPKPSVSPTADVGRPVPHAVPTVHTPDSVPRRGAVPPAVPVGPSPSASAPIAVERRPVAWEHPISAEPIRAPLLASPELEPRPTPPIGIALTPEAASVQIEEPTAEAILEVPVERVEVVELDLADAIDAVQAADDPEISSNLPDAEPMEICGEAIPGSVEPSVDARISSWNPTWFDRPQAGVEEPRDSELSAPQVDDASRFSAGTQWVAPADCLDTISTSYESQSVSGLATDFTASTGGLKSPETEATEPADSQETSTPLALEPPAPTEQPRERQAGKPSRAIQEQEARESASSEQVSEPSASQDLSGKAPAQDSNPDRSGRASWSARDLGVSTALSRPLDEMPRTSAVSDWPSVDDILAAHRREPSPWEQQTERMMRAASAERKPGRGSKLAKPTLAREPDCWELPLWLGWPPLAFVSLLLGVLGCLVTWSWTTEARNASIVANRLLGKEAEMMNGRPIPLPEWVVPPSPGWWRSTPRHLTNWAAFLGRSADSFEHAVEIRELLDGAVAASPVYAPARLALARLEEGGREASGEPSTRGLALSRDPVAMAWTAHKLLKAGRKDVALPLYRQALELATEAELSHETVPKFTEDETRRRYLLPGEEAAREILAGLVADRGLKFSDWSSILPEGTVAPLVAAQLLRDESRRDAESSIDLILQAPARDSEPEDADRSAEAIRHAVRAEALAMRSNWKEAEKEYREAIDGMEHQATCRSWWLNLADIELSLKNDTQWQEAIKNALASAPTSDEIARRAADLRRGQRPPAEQTSRVRSAAGLKAN